MNYIKLTDIKSPFNLFLINRDQTVKVLTSSVIFSELGYYWQLFLDTLQVSFFKINQKNWEFSILSNIYLSYLIYLILQHSKIKSITAFKDKNKAEEKAIETERKQSSRCNRSESFNVKDLQMILSKGDWRLCYQWKG